MKYITNYNAPPSADMFKPASVEELRLIQAEIMESEKSSLQTEWSQSAWSTDASGISAAIELSTHGEQILVAQDEDGFYFATANYGIERKAQ